MVAERWGETQGSQCTCGSCLPSNEDKTGACALALWLRLLPVSSIFRGAKTHRLKLMTEAMSPLLHLLAAVRSWYAQPVRNCIYQRDVRVESQAVIVSAEERAGKDITLSDITDYSVASAVEISLDY